jgi:hypothetical protein
MHNETLSVVARLRNAQEGHKYASVLFACCDHSGTMEMLAREIERQMHGQWEHCAIYEKDLERL